MKDIYVLLDDIRSIYNVGSIFRSCEAVGVKKIFLCGISGIERFGDIVKLNPKVAKTALQGINTPWEYSESSTEKLEELRKDGVQIVSLELTPKSIDFRKAEYRSPLCLVVGHEKTGVKPEISEIADYVIKIPMQGVGKSLNVSVATAVALYEIVK